MSSDFGTEYYYRYAQSLRASGNEKKQIKSLQLSKIASDDRE
jgi:hypothetical protein